LISYSYETTLAWELDRFLMISPAGTAGVEDAGRDTDVEVVVEPVGVVEEVVVVVVVSGVIDVTDEIEIDWASDVEVETGVFGAVVVVSLLEHPAKIRVTINMSAKNTRVPVLATGNMRYPPEC
jgi:hypothetical protein